MEEVPWEGLEGAGFREAEDFQVGEEEEGEDLALTITLTIDSLHPYLVKEPKAYKISLSSCNQKRN